MMKMEKPPSVRSPLSTSSKPPTFCTSSMKRYFVPETASRGPTRASSCPGVLTDRYPYRSRPKKTMRSSSTPSALSSSAMHCMRRDLPPRRTPVMTLIIPSSW